MTLSSARRFAAFVGCALAIGVPGAAHAQTSDLVDRATLRVCADPANMPVSNEKGEGFENKIAELLAKDLGVPLAYTWFPDSTGFYRMTLGIKKCDVVLGVPSGADPYLNTNAFMRTTSILIVKKGGPLDGVDTLSDPRLKDRKLGLTAGTPVAAYFQRNGLMVKAKAYNLFVDRRYFSPAEDMIKDIQSGEIDGGVLWAPVGSYYAAKSPDLVTVPLVKEQGGPPLAYRLTFGIRPNEENWKHRLNEFISKHQEEINKILTSYGIPLLDESDKPIQVSQ